MSNVFASSLYPQNDPLIVPELCVEPDEWPVQDFRAMGSHMSARLACSPAQALMPLQDTIRIFANAEARLSRFWPDSELSQLNAHAGRWQRVSPLLWAVLDTALEMAAATDGLFDPTLLAAINHAGYDRDFAIIGVQSSRTTSPMPDAARDAESDAEVSAAVRAGSWQQIALRPATREVLLPLGLGIDLGGIAKGMVAAKAVEQLRAFGPCLVDAGGDVVAGDAPPGWPGWPVAIAAPTLDAADDLDDGLDDDLTDDLAMVWLRDATLATSGIDYRRWQRNGKWQHHILDPRRGQPAATDLISVTVLAAHSAEAEAWAKSALILGAKAGEAALTTRDIAALLVRSDGRVTMTPALHRHLV